MCCVAKRAGRPNSSKKEVRAVIHAIVNDKRPTNGTKLVRYSQVKKFLATHVPGLVQHLKVPPALIEAVEADRADRLATRENLHIKWDWTQFCLGNPVQR